MKKYLSVIVFAILIFTQSCASSDHLLDTVTKGDITYKLYGTDRVERITVSDGDGKFYDTIAYGTALYASDYDHYGFTAQDLNFDGKDDLVLITGRRKGITSLRCWLCNSEGDGFDESSELSALHNIKIDPETKTLSAYKYVRQNISIVPNAPPVYNDIFTWENYIWKNGKLQLDSYTSMTFYSDEDIWSYGTYGKEFGDEIDLINEKWFETDELPDYDFRPAK